MKEEEKSVIVSNLIHLNTNTCGQLQLVTILHAAGLLRETDKDMILAEKIPFQQNDQFYRLITKGGATWTILMDALNNSGNIHIRKYLNKKLKELIMAKHEAEVERDSQLTFSQLQIEMLVKEYRKTMKNFTESKSKDCTNLPAIKEQHNRLVRDYGQRFLTTSKLDSDSSEQFEYLTKLKTCLVSEFGILLLQITSDDVDDEDTSLEIMENIPASEIVDWRVGKTYGEKREHFLKNFSVDNDITFLVGPEKEEIRTSKMRLVIASSTFEQILKMEEGKKDKIVVPEYDKKVFRAFIKLLPPASQTAVIGMMNMEKFSQAEILQLMVICEKYGMSGMTRSWEDFLEPLFFGIHSFVNSKEFLELPRESLDQLLRCDFVPLDECTIFEKAYNWAEHYCTQIGLQPNGSNIRKALGYCLYEIRYPTMHPQVFSGLVSSKEVLTDDEELRILEYFSISADERRDFTAKTPNFPFKTNARSTKFVPTTETIDISKGTLSPPFVCNGQKCETQLSQNKYNSHLRIDKKIDLDIGNSFRTTHRIALHSVGFQGPIHSDAFLQVFIQLRNATEDKELGNVTHNVFAFKGKPFFVHFEDPIVLEASYTSYNDWKNIYIVHYTLKGPNTLSNVIETNKNVDQLVAGVTISMVCKAPQVMGIKFRKLS